MEKFTFEYTLKGKSLTGQRAVCGVVGSGNLEVIIAANDSDKAVFTVQTSVDHFKETWKLVIDNFVQEYQPTGLSFALNDNGGTPAVVALRLRQALENFQGYHKLGKNYLELDARARIAAIVDNGSFKEWLTEPLYSPHLAALGLPGEGDDGVVIGSAKFSGKNILIAAQQKDFMGGAVGEIHGAKITGLFRAAENLKVAAVLFLLDSGGVRLHEANAGEISISEIVRSIFAARKAGVVTLGIVCGKNGAYGGMGITSTCLDHVIVNEVARTGVSGAEVIEAVKGVEAFDAQDRPLMWRVYGGKTRYLQNVAQQFVGFDVPDIQAAIKTLIDKPVPLSTAQLKQQHQALKNRFNTTTGFSEEGTYLHKLHPELSTNLFDANKETFLKFANTIKTKE